VILQTKEDIMNNGHGQFTSQDAAEYIAEVSKTDRTVTICSCGAEVEAQPMKAGVCYECYRNPINEAQQIERVIDATLHAEDSRFKKLGGYVKPTRNANGHTDTIQTAIDKGQLDANGHMLPYKATGRVGGSWDNHEVHSYTADGE